MKKWIKRLILSVVTLAIVLALTVVGLYVYGVRRTPEWLKRPVFTAAEQAAAANRLDQKIMEALSQVGEMEAYHAASTTQQHQQADSEDKRPVATQPARALRVSFTEQELNASFAKWDRLYGWTERYKNYVHDPVVVLHEGRIVLAGQSEEMGTVVSLHFEPKLDEKGRLHLRLSHLQAGRLPLPQAFFEGKRESLRGKLQAVLPGLQRRAELRSDGSANTEAMSAAMAKLVLAMLADEPGEPVLFLPVRSERSVPVRLTDVKIEDKALTLTVKPLNPKERVSLLERIREPYDKETALSPSRDPSRETRRRS